MRISIILFLLAMYPAKLFAQGVTSRGPIETNAAIHFFSEHQKLIDEILKDQFKLDPRLAISIVLPEVGHFSLFQNAIETSALQVFYIQLGPDYANFSIGRFQMKPSFVERLEKNLATTHDPFLVPFAKIFAYSSSDSIKIRTERVDRLCSLEWQLRYLGLFCATSASHSGESLLPETLALYAGAYNYDWQVSRVKILAWNERRNFPSGKGKSTDTSYSKLSLEYYNLINPITNP